MSENTGKNSDHLSKQRNDDKIDAQDTSHMGSSAESVDEDLRRLLGSRPVDTSPARLARLEDAILREYEDAMAEDDLSDPSDGAWSQGDEWRLTPLPWYQGVAGASAASAIAVAVWLLIPAPPEPGYGLTQLLTGSLLGAF